MKQVSFFKNLALSTLALMTLTTIGCGGSQKQAEAPPEEEPLILALAAENTAGNTRGACLLQLSFAPSERGDSNRVRNVHVIHRAGLSEEALVASQNKTLKRILNPSKESATESIPEFGEELRRLVSQASSAGIATDCLEVAKNLAGQLEDRAKAVASLRSKTPSGLSLNFGSDIICDYDCGPMSPPIMNNYYPYNQPYQYDRFGPTWTGGYGTPDTFTNSFFNNYYGGYQTGDVLYAGAWGAVGSGLKRAHGAASTTDTIVGGCQDAWGNARSCAVGAAKAWGTSAAGDALVNRGMTALGAGRFSPHLSIIMSVFDQSGGRSTLADICGRSDPYCENYKYNYR